MIVNEFNPVILNAGKAENLSDWNYRNVSNPFARIYLVTDGEASVRIGTTVTNLLPGHLYLIPPFVLHDNICEHPFTHFYLHFFEEGKSLFDDLTMPIEVPAEDLDRMLFERLIKSNPSLQLGEYDPKSYSDGKTIFRNFTAEFSSGLSSQFEECACILNMMSRFLQEATPKRVARDRKIRDILDFIHDNLSSSDLNVEALADRSCLSVNQFIRKFSAETLKTPVRYITDKRMEKARVLLLESGMENKAVAAAVGYEDPAYFCRVFRKTVGVSPQQYRKSALESANLFTRI